MFSPRSRAIVKHPRRFDAGGRQKDGIDSVGISIALSPRVAIGIFWQGRRGWEDERQDFRWFVPATRLAHLVPRFKWRLGTEKWSR